MNNILENIGDVLLVTIKPEISGIIQFTGYTETWNGLQAERTVRREFRILQNDIFWTEWKELNPENLSSQIYNVENGLQIQVRYTRYDGVGTNIFEGIVFNGTRVEDVETLPTLLSSIFASLWGTEKLYQLEANLFKKLYFRGIIPAYITRAENVDLKEDSDFVDLFFSIARLYALIICFSGRLENFYDDYDLMLENVRQSGLYFDESNTTLEQLQHLSSHYYDEIRKRGTAMIFKKEGDIVNGVELTIDGEFRRLLRSKTYDELLYENIPLNLLGWCLGNCSPVYRGTCGDPFLNKTAENTEDFQSLDNFIISGLESCTLVDEDINGNPQKVMQIQISGTDANLGAGIGRRTTEIDPIRNDQFRELIPVDVSMDYEITFMIKADALTDAKLLFGIEGIDSLGNKLFDSFVTPTGTSVTEDFINLPLNGVFAKSNQWYFVRGIIYAYSSQSLQGIAGQTNLNVGNNLIFNNPFVKYIIPRIQLVGAHGSEMQIWNYKMRPLVRGTNIRPLQNGTENSHSLGFIQTGRMFYGYLRNNNNTQSKQAITDIIERYLLPYNMKGLYVFMTKF